MYYFKLFVSFKLLSIPPYLIELIFLHNILHNAVQLCRAGQQMARVLPDSIEGKTIKTR